jgi:tripartite-type tricarboxylate transporter receptor subunit TctC
MKFLGHLTVAAGLLFPAAPAPAQPSYPAPGRIITIVVPFSLGTGPDILARLMGQKLGERWGASIIVDNKPGASGNIGTELVAKAPGDGYTLMMTATSFALNAALNRSAPYDPLKSFAPVALVATGALAFAVSTDMQAKTLKEFVALAKARPGELNYASYGAGSGPHLATEMFMGVTGIRMVHVPYGGGGPAALGAVTNQVQALFSSVLPVLGMIRGGSLKAIAIASDHRSELLPSVPTFAEGGLDYRTGTWFGLLAPAQTPPTVIDILHRTTVAVLKDESVRARIVEQGAEVVADTPAEFRAFIGEETERLARVIRGAGIRLD